MKKTYLHKIYYGLAMIDVFAIIMTLLLAYTIYSPYEESYSASHHWQQRNANYDRLTAFAIKASAPGNALFTSQDAITQRKDLIQQSAQIQKLTNALLFDAKSHLPDHPDIPKHLTLFLKHLEKANTHRVKILSMIEKNQHSDAAHSRPQMEKQFYLALLETSLLKGFIRHIQTEKLTSNPIKAKNKLQNEFYIALCLSLLIGGLLLFGQQFKRKLTRQCHLLEERNEDLSNEQIKKEALLTSLDEGILILNTKGIIEYTNPAIEKMFQYSKTQLLGKDFTSLTATIPHNHTKKTLIEKITAHKKNNDEIELKGLKKDRTIFSFSLKMNALALKNKTVLTGVLKEIIQSKTTKCYLSSLSKIQNLYISGNSQNKIFNEILSLILTVTDSEYGFIGGIYNDENKQKYLKTYAISNISRDKVTQQFYDKNAPAGLEFRNLDSLFGHTIKTSERVLTNAPHLDPRTKGLPPGHPKMNAYLGMPIISNKGAIGMFGIANRKQGYDENVIKELNTLLSFLTPLIELTSHLSVIEKMTNIDSLSGAYNRIYFKSFVTELLKKKALQRKNNSKFCIMIIDFNDFKNINDYYGHETGDFIIKEFVTRITKGIKDTDLLARIGGDEFAILIDEIEQFSNAGKVADRVISLGQSPYKLNNTTLKISLSIGIACYPISGKSIDELFRHADLALYKAKKNAHAYCYFSNDLQTEYLEHQHLERDLINAFKNNEFYCVIQPQIDSSTERTVGGEILIRWENKNDKQHTPDVFIKCIERMGKAATLNEYIVKWCIEKFKTYDLEKIISVSINISPAVYHLENSLKYLITLISAANINKNIHFNFEITESSFINSEVNFKKNSPIELALRENNIGLSLDDFGTEYSSLNRLFECDFSTLKIDMSFVKMLNEKNNDTATSVIHAIIKIGESLNINIIAEGAETKEQVQILSRLGCHIIQGYYYHKPMPIDEFFKLL